MKQQVFIFFRSCDDQLYLLKDYSCSAISLLADYVYNYGGHLERVAVFPFHCNKPDYYYFKSSTSDLNYIEVQDIFSSIKVCKDAYEKSSN